MFSSYFSHYSTLYLTLEQLRTMGRTYGTDLIVPNFPRHQTIQSQQQQQHQSNSHHQQLPNVSDQTMEPSYQQHYLQQQQQHQPQVLDLKRETHSPQTTQLQQKSTSKKKKEKKVTEENVAQNDGAVGSPEIKFSIDRILGFDRICNSDESERKCEDANEDNEVDDEVDEESTDTQVDVPESATYDWLQCTRYKPPKLQRE